MLMLIPYKETCRLIYYWMLVDLTLIRQVVITKFKLIEEKEKQTELNYSFVTAMEEGISIETSNNNIFYPKPNSVNYGVMKFVCELYKVK